MTAFVEALIRGDLDAIRRCPKADLHNHCGGSGDREFLRERTGIDVAPLTCTLRSMDEMHAWAKTNIAPVYARDESGMLEAEASLALAKRDGVTRLELGYDVWAITKGRSAKELTKLMAQVSRQRRTSNGFRNSPCRGTARSPLWRDGSRHSWSSMLTGPSISQAMNWPSQSRTSCLSIAWPKTPACD